MSYDNAEPKVLKTLNSNGQVLNDSGEVIGETSDYWVRTYNQTEPKVDKILHSDGTIKDAAGNLIQDTTEFNVKKYNQAEPIPAKYLHADGTIDENPGSGGDNLQDNKTATIDVSNYSEPVEIEPDSGYDGMKKVTASLSNIPIPGNNLYAWRAGGSVVYTVTDNPDLTAEIYGCISSEGMSLFANMTSDNFKIIQILDNVLRIGSDSEHWAPYERNSNYDTTLDGVDLDSNKTVTIDVSQYSEPIEITPTSGKDGMKKATITLDNIPYIPKIEENKTQTIDVSEYTEPIEIYPSSGRETMFDAMEKVTVTLSNIPSGGATLYCWMWDGASHFLSVNTSPADFDAYKDVKELYVERGGAIMVGPLYDSTYDVGYYRESDTEFTVIDEDGSEKTFIRYSAGDIPIW